MRTYDEALAELCAYLVAGVRAYKAMTDTENQVQATHSFLCLWPLVHVAEIVPDTDPRLIVRLHTFTYDELKPYLEPIIDFDLEHIESRPAPAYRMGENA